MKTKIFLLIIGLAVGTFAGLYFTQFKSVLTLKRSVKTEVDYGKENDFLSDLINKSMSPPRVEFGRST